MKAFIYFKGDPSVGIFSQTYSIEDIREPEDADDRLFIRRELGTCFSNIEEESCDVWFDDECPECGDLLSASGHCENKKCIAYFLFENTEENPS